MLCSENHSHSSMDLGDKLALGSLVINPENESNGILARNVVCYAALQLPRRGVCPKASPLRKARLGPVL